MIKLFDRVKIKSSGVIGFVVDISVNGIYTVESESHEIGEGAYPAKWPLYDCDVSDLSLVNDMQEPIIELK